MSVLVNRLKMSKRDKVAAGLPSIRGVVGAVVVVCQAVRFTSRSVPGSVVEDIGVFVPE